MFFPPLIPYICSLFEYPKIFPFCHPVSSLPLLIIFGEANQYIRSALLYGTAGRKKRGLLVVNKLQWPIFLSLLLSPILPSIASLYGPSYFFVSYCADKPDGHISQAYYDLPRSRSWR